VPSPHRARACARPTSVFSLLAAPQANDIVWSTPTFIADRRPRCSIPYYRIFRYWIFRFIGVVHTKRPRAKTVWIQQREYKRAGNVLAAARRQSGLTQEELAKRLGKPQSFVSNYEKGQRRVDVLEMLLIVETLGGDPREVFADMLALRSRPKKRAK
jgi:DNA-binding transcriptional regulator YiaG